MDWKIETRKSLIAGYSTTVHACDLKAGSAKISHHHPSGDCALHMTCHGVSVCIRVPDVDTAKAFVADFLMLLQKIAISL